jgi:hypothetical protein
MHRWSRCNTKEVRRVTLRQTCVFASGAICGSRSAFYYVWGMKRWHTTIHTRLGQCGFHKRRQWTCYAKHLFFTSSGICLSRSAFRFIQGTKYQCTIFYARLGMVRIPKKSIGRRYIELVSLHPMGSAGHVVHYGASGA